MTINARMAMENVRKYHEQVEMDAKNQALEWVENNAVKAIETASKNGNHQVMLRDLPKSGTIRKYIKNELIQAGFAAKEEIDYVMVVRWDS